MNVAILMGRLTRDPELRTTTDGMAITRYTLAVDRMKKDEADFINIVTFGKAAEFADKFFRKGMKVAVSGRIQTGSYTGKDGRKVYTTEVVADRQEFCESKSAEPKTERPDGFMNIPGDEDLPFA